MAQSSYLSNMWGNSFAKGSFAQKVPFHRKGKLTVDVLILNFEFINQK